MNQLEASATTDSSPAPILARSSYASRHDRRRLETRARMLRALMKLLARKSLADVPIHEITETADVGGGTFYNHFTDRASIHGALTAELYPTTIRASAQGFTYNIGRVASATAPFTVGTLAATRGFGAAFAVAGVAFFVAALAWRFIPETRGRELT